MQQKKKESKIGLREVQYVSAIFVILLAASFLLSSGTRLSFLGGYVFSYVFGSVGYFAFPALMILFAIGLFVPKLGDFLGMRFFVGYVFIVIGICAISSNAYYNGSINPSSFTVYQDAFARAGTLRFGYSFEGALCGGAIGFLISSLPGSPNLSWIIYLTGSLVIAFGLFVAFYPLWRRLVRLGKAASAISKSKKKRRQQDRAKQIEEEAHEKATRIAMEEPTQESRPNNPSNPLDSLIFQPAKNATSIPLRSSKYKKNGENAAKPASNMDEDTSYPHASAPRAMPNPSVESYRGSTLKTFGLQEAFFDPFADQTPVAPRPSEPEFVPAKPAPSPNVPSNDFEATPLVDLAPSFIPTASTKPNKPIVSEPTPTPTPTPSPSPSSIFDAEEEEIPIPQEKPIQAKPIQQSLFDEESFPPLPSLDEEVTPSYKKAPVAPVEAPQIQKAEEPATQKEEEKDELQEEPESPLPPYRYPPLTLLSDPDNSQNIAQMEAECAEKEEIINQTFQDLGVGARVAGHTIGPSVTRYAIQPDRNVSVASLARYVKDIEVRIGGVPTRYAERVAGMTTPALETANNVVRMVTLKECITSLPPLSEKTRMIIPFGVKITGETVYANLCEFPHLLLAGTTGSGKSVFVHSILLSLIMRNRPEELKLVLVDPKRVEMTKYKDIPHLLCPIIKEAVHAKNALKKLVDEMERRYRLFDRAAVQKIDEYNADYAPVYHKKKLPYILLVVDEYYDLVNTCKEVSEYVLTLGAKARACGIHMIIATQRPDSKVISGTIKANLPTAVALSVRSSVDSSVILGSPGAEDLAGHGDMLIDCAQIAKKEFVRAQGCFVDNKELRAVPEFVRGQQQVQYHPAFLDLDDKEDEPSPDPSYGGGVADAPMPSSSAAAASDGEAKYQYVKSIIMTREFASISQIQRDFSVGFPRAGKIFARLQKEGIVDTTPVSSSKGCRVLVHEAPSTSSAGSVSTSTTEPSWKSDPEEDIA